MRLTEQSRYALRVLAHCAERHPALAKVATIAAVTGITEQNIFKLIKTLTKAGFVETIRGPHGGVRLAMAPKAIRVGQVIRAIEPRFKACGPLGLILSDAPVSAVERELDRTIGRGIAAFMETLDRTTIAALVAKTANAALSDCAACGAPYDPGPRTTGRRRAMTIHQNFIAGNWTPAGTAAPNINPSNTKDVVGEYARASRAEAEDAIKAAKAASAAYGALDAAGTLRRAEEDLRRDPGPQGRARPPAVARGRQDAARRHRRGDARRPDLRVLRRRGAAHRGRKAGERPAGRRRRDHARAGRRGRR